MRPERASDDALKLFSESSGSATNAPDRAPAIDEVVALLRAGLDGERLDEERMALAEKFVPLFFRKAPLALLEERGAEALARTCMDSLRFLERSRPDRVDVEVLNPDAAAEAAYGPVTVVRTNISERPFIVDTIREFLSSRELKLRHRLYPVMSVERDEEGRIVDIRSGRDGGSPSESLVYYEVAEVAGDDVPELEREIARRLGDVVKATDDFQAMLGTVTDVVAELGYRSRDDGQRRAELEEVQAFLRWLRDGAFVFLGYRYYEFAKATPDAVEKSVAAKAGSGLGILRDETRSSFHKPVPLSRLPKELRDRAFSGPVLFISKTNAESTVHRRARMDYVSVMKVDPSGGAVGEHRFIGLFTSQAYSDSAQDIPILRKKLDSILARSGVAETGHDYKEIITIFDSLPREELFLAAEEEIEADIETIIGRYNTGDVTVTVRQDELGRGVAIMVVLPRSRFSGAFRKEFGAALSRRYHAEIRNYHLSMNAGDQARLHFYLGGARDRLAEVDAAELEQTVADLTRSWLDEVQARLADERPADEARRLAAHYGAAFAPEYKAASSPEVAVRDILVLETMKADGARKSVWFFDDPELQDDAEPLLKVYVRGKQIVLSEFMPVLENCGLQVIAVSPFEIHEQGGGEGAVIYSFNVQTSGGSRLDVTGRGEVLSDTILAVLAGDATNDPFNRLVQHTGLTWKEVAVLRAYAHYAFQIGAVPSREVLPAALDAHPEAGRLLFDFFRVRFEPPSPDAPDYRSEKAIRNKQAARLRREFAEALDRVSSLAFDRALRALQTVVRATVRTNYFLTLGTEPVRRSGGAPYVSFKFDCARTQGIARSRLKFEVWVQSPRMEGVHLRGAAVARGGIRHSDRPDDFRTEVLGLVNTQMVKNAVIVPGGSKGGFVCLRDLADRGAAADEVREQYCTLIRGLLDVTDNLNGEPASPKDLVRYDLPDPYLVVAADKGTAQFSDTANAVAREYDYWLGDAFASGGSNGYDHKEVGITAGGAWESVMRHFRETGKDVQTEPFTVAGIGDMSGDVFGNGMLLSRRIRLVAAFDHRHVFIDPDPDAESSFEERRRLFDLGRSSWDDYDRAKLSPGGMIVPRSLKSVELSDEARKALGLEPDVQALDGESLIRAVLRAPVELLWNGGIGTYVKAGWETDADAGDPSNDPVRVDAGQLRAKVVGEGGNLGFTQAARVEYALAGGRINTDALDNSGGVNLSDREVNLKILLAAPVRRSEDATSDERNELLRRVTGAVAAQVLRDNESQSRAVSLDEYRARRGSDHFWALMNDLVRWDLLDRNAEGLPSWDQLNQRRESHQTMMTRPELAVLLSYAKLHVKSELLASPLPDDPVAAEYFYDYFPGEAVEFVGRERAAAHRLRREIVACQLTNDMVDLMGAAFVARVARETGRTPAEVVRSWLVASQLTNHRSLMDEVRSREATVSTGAAYRWTMGLARVLERTTRWVLANCDPAEPAREFVERNLRDLASLRGKFHEIVAGDDRDVFANLVKEIGKLGVDEHFARNFITLRFLDHLLEILGLARTTGADPVDAARVYYDVTEKLRIPWLARTIERASASGRWERRWGLGLVNDLGAARRRLTEEALAGAGQLAPKTAKLRRFHDVLDEVTNEKGVSLAGLSVAVQEIRGLADGAPARGRGSEAGGRPDSRKRD